MAEAPLAPAQTPRTRTTGTRNLILAAAEDEFATRGFSATRLEDVAAQVGIRRASIVYYFRDKQELYDAVFASAVGGLYAEVAPILEGSGALGPRIEAAVAAWVDYVTVRPALPLLLLREFADAARGHETLRRHTEPFFELAGRLVREGRGDPFFSDALPAAQIASAVAGTSVFFQVALPVFAPDSSAPASDAARLEHREQLLALVRRLLGRAPLEAV